jgi:hypothetical protein
VAGLNIKYIPLNILQQYFVDKNTGFPLDGGKVYFFSDKERTVPKEVFQISGTPPDYTYTTLGYELTLSSQGTFIDENGSDISVYAYPYNEKGNLELYYIYVTDNLGAFQWDREGVPNLGSQSAQEAALLLNYCTNPQFLSHTNVGLDGKITEGETPIATGGWYFMRPSTSTAIDYVLFDEFGSVTTNPTGNPKYAVRISTQVPNSGDAYKALSLRFDNVNTFALNPQTYSFSATSNAGSDLAVELNVVKHYGDGGSPDEVISISNLVISNSYSTFNSLINFPSNEGKTLGENSYIAIEIWLPTSYLFDASFTDFVLTPGNVSITQFPVTPTFSVESRSVAGFLPVMNPDGSDLYLPILSTREGLTYDYSIIGKVFSCTYPDPGIGELLCDASQYKSDEYSSDGIPYFRLRNSLWIEDIHCPRYGTGVNYLTGVRYGASSSWVGGDFLIRNNKLGVVSDTVDGAVPTGFIFDTVHAGSSTGYYVISYKIAPTIFYIENTELGDGTSGAGTSGFTCSQVEEGNGTIIVNIESITTIAATGLAGKYFTFNSRHLGNDEAYYVWFKVDGAGSDPSVGGRTAILVKLKSTDTADIVAEKVSESLNGFQVSIVSPTLPTVIPVGSYFLMYATSGEYYVWYQIDGVGVDPKVSNAIGVKVSLSSTDTIMYVGDYTQWCMNRLYFAVPDFRGMILRGQGGSINGWDPDALTRYSMVPGLTGDLIGTYENDQNIQHLHSYIESLTPNAGSVGTVNSSYGDANRNTSLTGGKQANPVNISVNYVIKY